MHSSRTLSLLVFLPMLFLPVALTGQTAQKLVVPLRNWAAPPYWQPSQADREAAPGIRPFATQTSTSALTFVAIAPCRLVDTRGLPAGFTGVSPFSGPSFTPSSTVTFPVQSTAETMTTTPSPCGTIPSAAQAYSFNITVIPKTAGGVAFLTVWPSGGTQPGVSTINDGQGDILANAAIVPAGTPNGGVSVFNSGPAAMDLIIDMNGYYAATGGSGGGGSITGVTAGTDLTGGGTGGVVTLNLDTTKVPTLAGANTFTGSNTFASLTAAGNITTTSGSINTANVTATGTVTADLGVFSGGNINVSGDIYVGGNVVYQQPYGSTTNTAVGVGANGGSDSSGTGNTASGYCAMNGNGGGCGSAPAARPMPRAQGRINDPHPDTSAGPTGSYNTAHGYQALSSLTGGNYNTAHGAMALSSNTSAYSNTAIGAFALSSNTTGAYNTATGDHALGSNIGEVGSDTGSFNTADGEAALYSNTNGSENVAVGSGALYPNTTGRFNTAIGYNSLGSNITGSNNIALGFEAGLNVFGNSNIHIGTEGAPADNSVIRIGGNVALGDQVAQTAFYVSGIAGVNVSGAPVLINTSTGQLGVASSSRRFKEDIQDMSDASDGLMRLRPVTFRYKQPFDDGAKPIQYGLIAEEVAEVYPDLVARSADGQIETVKYQLLDPMLLNEVQKQYRHAQQQDETIQHQNELIGKLEARLAALEALVSGKSPATGAAGR
jgi:hypothetical protein